MGNSISFSMTPTHICTTSLPLSMQVKFLSLWHHASEPYHSYGHHLPTSCVLLVGEATQLMWPNFNPSDYSQLLHLWKISLNSNIPLVTTSYLYPSASCTTSFSFSSLLLEMFDPFISQSSTVSKPFFSYPNWTSRSISWTTFLTILLFMSPLTSI